MKQCSLQDKLETTASLATRHRPNEFNGSPQKFSTDVPRESSLSHFTVESPRQPVTCTRSVSTARSQNTFMKPATLGLACEKSKTITKTSKVMATGREIVANLPGRNSDEDWKQQLFQRFHQEKTPENATSLPVPQVTAWPPRRLHTLILFLILCPADETLMKRGEKTCVRQEQRKSLMRIPRRDSHEEGGRITTMDIQSNRKSSDSSQVASPGQDTHEEAGSSRLHAIRTRQRHS